MGYDIIGDIHGHADKLEALLGRLGYALKSGAWRHPTRTVIFVGDLIDRGPGQLRTLNLVRAMCDAGSAEVAMGNHELNAIGWATPDPEAPDDRLRPRHGPRGLKNRKQHEAFLSEVGEDSAAHAGWIRWFESLPLFIEKDDLRVVHACWDPKAVETLRGWLKPDDTLPNEAVHEAFRADQPARHAIDVILKGPEVALPGGFGFTDKDGHVRHEIRTRWWDPAATSFREAYIGPDAVEIPDVPLPEATAVPPPDRATFIGHYWLNPAAAPEPLTDQVACVDYSVAKGGPLVAYRFDGEDRLSPSKFVSA